jgi:hypothetical protein
MKLSYVGAVAMGCLVLALVLVQLWLIEQRQEANRRWVADQQAALERAAIQPPAPGQPWVPPPPVVYLPPPTPPIFPFPVVYGPLMAVMALLAQAEHQRQERERQAEEEDRTGYTEDDLMDNWEFKIIRSPVGLFDRPDFLERVLQEEGRAGWRLVEKFDGTRVRLKRVAGASPSADVPPGYDPYRTVVGPRVKAHVALWVFCALCLIPVPIAIAAHLADAISPAVLVPLIAVPAVLAVALGFTASRLAAKYRRLAYQSE